MYFIPAGLVLKHNPHIVALMHGADLSNLTAGGFVFRNLLPVAAGNMVGGALFVGAVYWILYLRKPVPQSISETSETLTPDWSAS